MTITSEILEFYPQTGSILVRYSDGIATLEYSVDLPIANNGYPSEAEAMEYIKQFEPTSQLDRLAKTKIITIPEYLKVKIRAVIIDGQL